MINPAPDFTAYTGPATKLMQSDYVALMVNIFRAEDAMEILVEFLDRHKT
jgi:hypothetical protein